MTNSDPAPPTTTTEQDRQAAGVRAGLTATAHGQRRVNLIWESTQAVIAVAVTASLIYAELHQIPADNLSRAFTLIIAIYFVRMNHIKVGGVGPVDTR